MRTKTATAMMIATVFTSAAVSGCATTGSSGGGTALDRAQGQCIAAVTVGVLLGAALGNNIGDGNAGRGALLGAGAGGIACAIIAEAAREREAVLAHQRAAATEGTSSRSEWVSNSGRRVVMNVQVEPDPDEVATADYAASDASAEVPTLRCRYSTSTMEIAGMGSASLGRQRWCQQADGTWQTAT